MNIPKVIRKYCAKCKTHTEQKVSIYKAGKRSEVQLEENVDMLKEKRDMEDRNSQNLQNLQKLPRKLHL